MMANNCRRTTSVADVAAFGNNNEKLQEEMLDVPVPLAAVNVKYRKVQVRERANIMIQARGTCLSDSDSHNNLNPATPMTT